MRRVLAAVTMALFLQVAAIHAADEQTIDSRLSELEKRLKALEEREQQRAVEAEETEKSEMTVELEELRRQVGILAEEVEKMRSGEEGVEITQERASSLGLGPSAASVYRKQSGVSIAGYGEMLYSNFADQNQSGTPVDKISNLDFLRAIFYAGYRFNDRFLFNSEIEVEHATTDKSGSASVEFAYVEYLINKNLTARGGMLLVPMGFVNEFHEPNVFLGALRPRTEQVIMPTTWRENGFGVTGSYGPLNFRTYLVNGLDAGGFSAGGFRGGRQKGSKAKAGDMAFVARGDLNPTPGIVIGGSIYHGGSDHGQFKTDIGKLDLGTTIWEVHGEAKFRGWDLRGLLAGSHLQNAGLFNELKGLSGSDGIAESMRGGYLQLGYNLLSGHHESMGLTPYYRFESVDTQHKMPVGFFSDPANNQDFHTLGFEFKPIYNIVIKTDYQWLQNGAKTGLNQFNIGLGYSF
ncbi:MAG: hypothetical protein JSU96_18095 [Acidobacteriota bacterium]|nr:MAG: hypothetical protein JSU96_18095 [Acidobacteriota bacterium]